MNAIQDHSSYIFAVRMNWLRWLARPVVLLWRCISRLFRWFWSLCVLAWRSFVVSFTYRYWFLAVIGGSVAFFFILYFYFLGIRLKQPNLVWIGTVFASLPLGWSMAEIASLIRRKAVTGEEFTISEIRYQLGAGFKAVGMLLKYVLWAALLIAVQIGMGLIVHIPSAGPALFTILMVPVIILSVFAFVCIILLLFGLAIFPVHVLYSQPGEQRGFFRRQFAEAGFILGFLKKNFFRLTVGMIPVSILSIPLILIPTLLFGGAIGVSLFLTTKAMRFGEIFAGIPPKIQSVLMMLSRGNWDVWGALSAIFVSVSMAILAGMVVSLVVSFLASFHFNVYTGGMYVEGYARETRKKDEEYEPAPVAGSEDEKRFLPLPEDLIEDEKFKLDDLDSDSDFLGASTIAVGAGVAGVAAGAAAGMAFSGSLPVASGGDRASAPSIHHDEDGFGDISGDDILASIESTMPIAGDNQVETDTTAIPEDESLSLLDMDNPQEFGDDISGNDILASIESTMEIGGQPVESGAGFDPAGVLPEDESLSIEDLTINPDGGMDDDVSGEDILASIESTMPIAEEGSSDFVQQLEAENDSLASLDVDSALEGNEGTPESDDTLDVLSNDLDDLLAGTDSGSGTTLDDSSLDDLMGGFDASEGAPVPPPQQSPDDEINLDELDGELDSILASQGGSASEPDGGTQDTTGLDDDLDAILGGSAEPTLPAPGEDTDLDSLLGGEEAAAAAPAGDDLSGLDGDLDALLGGEESAPVAPAGDDLSGFDGGFDDLPGGDTASAAPAAEDFAGSDSDLDALMGGGEAASAGDDLSGLDGDLDALLGGGDAASATSAGDGLSGPDNDLDALMGGGETAPAAPAGDDLSGLDGDLDALLGGGDAAPAAPAGDDFSDQDSDLDALMGGGDAAPAASAGDDLSGLDGDLDALLGGGDAAPAGDDLDALLGGGDMASSDTGVDAAPSAPVMPAAVNPFSDKGTIRQYGYLVSVKENNRVYFGIRGSGLGAPENFTLNIGYAGGNTASEQVTIDSLDEKGMGYARLDLSGRLQDPGYGPVTSVSVT